MTENYLLILQTLGCFVFAVLAMLETDKETEKAPKFITWMLCFLLLTSYTIYGCVKKNREDQNSIYYQIDAIWHDALSIGKVGDDTLKYYTDCKNSTRKRVDTNCLASTITLLEADGYSDKEIKAALDATKQISTNLKLLGDN